MNDIFLAEVIDLGSSFDTCWTTATNNEAQQLFPVFFSCSWQGRDFEIIYDII